MSEESHHAEDEVIDISDIEKTASFWGDPNLNKEQGETICQQVHPSQSPSSLLVKSYVMADNEQIERQDVDYVLKDKLGKGGMGDVYLAKQVSMDRDVAIKMIRPKKNMDEETKARFLSEAAVTGDLDHPNIVPIHALGCNEKGDLFYSMKRVVGQPWSKEFDQLTRDENLDILMRIADAVAFAHSKDVIHMDLKPENVMLGQFGEVYVMDWGLASAVHSSGKAKLITETDMIGGTPAYMSPEAAAGKAKRIDYRSDIYLLGAILFKIITGKPPHTGKNTSSCLVHAAKNVIQDPGFYDAFLPIAYKAMSTKNDDRYQNVAEFQAAVKVCRSHAESHSLQFQAECNLKEAQKTKEYDLFAQSIFAYREALRLWEDNKKANKGLIKTQHIFANVAYEKGDYDLALTLLNEEYPEHLELIQEINNAIKVRVERRRRIKLLSRVSKGLAISIILILGIAILWIYLQKTELQLAEENARNALAHEQEAKKHLETLRKRLEKAYGLHTNVKTLKGHLNQKLISPKGKLESHQYHPITLLYRSALFEFDLELAKHYAIKLSKIKNYEKTGKDCLKDILDYEKLITSLQSVIQSKPKQVFKLKLGNNHDISSRISIHDQGTLLIHHSKNNTLTKTILDLSNDTIESFLKEGSTMSYKEILRILALVTYARGQINEVKQMFLTIKESDPLHEHHMNMLKW